MAGRKKKEKVVYVDDGRTIADMSGVRGGFSVPKQEACCPRATLKEQWQTYKAATKIMLRPMLVVVAGIIVIYLLLTFLFRLL